MIELKQILIPFYKILMFILYFVISIIVYWILVGMDYTSETMEYIAYSVSMWIIFLGVMLFFGV